MADHITAYFKRTPGSINGVFTLQHFSDGDPEPRKIFERLPARSGQWGVADDVWKRGKGAIPQGRHMLWIDRSLQKDTLPGKGNPIGEFWNISTDGSDRETIRHPVDPSKIRGNIGLHPENQHPGSLGCIVLLVDTPARKAAVKALFEFFDHFKETGNTIDLVVFD